MRIPRIYTAQPLCVGSDAELDEIATHHIAKVLRMQVGQFLELFNGDQQNYQATITAIHKKRMVVTVTHNSPGVPASRLQTHIGQVVSKGDRMDYMVQKATELGVNIITPLFSERCDVKLNKEREEKRIRHWQQIAINASEQCGR
ncbi:MAG: 16S rRNA (uracil(1498)-N(3))-methyltransferase, partial [Pseudomonadales bacterium]|nr:16S rRNA (uracil(1498)-N(3))-methyltransferase [Pseudomonadales bacterium]